MGGYTKQRTRSSHILNLSDLSAAGREKLEVLYGIMVTDSVITFSLSQTALLHSARGTAAPWKMLRITLVTCFLHHFFLIFLFSFGADLAKFEYCALALLQPHRDTIGLKKRSIKTFRQGTYLQKSFTVTVCSWCTSANKKPSLGIERFEIYPGDASTYRRET